MNENWPKVKEIFSAALELKPDERVSFLNTACAADENLRSEVLGLLSAHDSSGDFIQHPAVVDVGFTINDVSDDTNHSAVTGQHIGTYEIIRELGRGGM